MNYSYRHSSAVVICAVIVFGFLTISASAQPWPAGIQFIREVKHDTSAPLADLHRMTPAQPLAFTPKLLKVLPTGPGAAAPASPLPDAALQEKFLPQVEANLGLNIDGLGQGQYGFGIQFAPPDTNGAVGATQYVQWVNAEFAVFDKSTGALVSGPTPGNAIWAGFGGPCQNFNDGDPIVQYDKIANRWILTQFVVSSQPYQQCVAVSTTSDATGTYHRYAFSFGNNFPDYPKLGVWPDAYYISFNMFLNGQIFNGASACAMNRIAMLNGNKSSIVCFQQKQSIASLLPADMDGTIQPKAGEPGFFATLGADHRSVRLSRFHIDFANPSNSRFTGPTVLPVAAFSPQCFSACVSQPATTQRLDALGDRPMYRLAYRKFADGHESLYMHHFCRDRDSLVRNPKLQQQPDSLSARNVRSGRKYPLDGKHRRRPIRRHCTRLQRSERLSVPLGVLHRTNPKRPTRHDGVGTDGRRWYRFPDRRSQPLGRLQLDDSRSG
jgi:hypothetical protein